MNIYVVQPGDTVYSIANKFNLPIEKIVHDNNISPDYGIVTGQIIILAYPKQTYKVQPGDTWRSIAAANGITIANYKVNAYAKIEAPDGNTDNSYYFQIGQVADLSILLSYSWASADINSYEQTMIPFLKGYIEYALTQIPPEKISLGYARIAYDWEIPYIENESPVTALANYQALALANQIGIDLGFDAYHVTPYFRYYTDGIEHFVWFKDARSLDAILNLIDEYNLSGISIWTTMDFTPQLWVTTNSQYNISKILNVTSPLLS